MAVNYEEQYRRDQLEPFWPNEFMKMSVAVLCTLAVIMMLVILPVVLDAMGLHGVMHEEEPANPLGGTPVGIKPEWYFLASYQYLRIMPTELLGISGKTLGVVTQGVVLLVLAVLPFWYRRKAHRRPGRAYRLTITVFLFALIGLTIWGGWPEVHGDDGERMASLGEYLSHRPLFFVMLAVALIVFYALIGHEKQTIRRTLDGPPAADPGETRS